MRILYDRHHASPTRPTTCWGTPPPRDSYEKQAVLYPGATRAECSKASGLPNVLSGAGKAVPEPGHGRPAQRVADPEAAEEMISAGWRFVGTLPTGRVVLESGPQAGPGWRGADPAAGVPPYSFPIRKTDVPQAGQLPLAAGRPFFRVTWTGSPIPTILRHFMQ